MPTSCAAFNCSNRFQKGGNISFHRFPFGNPELLSKWVTNIKREHFKPTKSHAICSEHFEKECFLENYCNIRKLKSDAVPTLFNFPVHLQKTLSARRAPRQRESFVTAGRQVNRKFGTPKESNDTEAVFHKVSVRHDHDYGEEVSPTKLKRKYEQKLESVQAKLESSRKKLRLMRKQCQRRDKKVISLSELLAELKKHSLLNELGINALENKFTGVTLELFRRSLQNTKSGYSDILRSFALTLHFNSPKAYEYVRQSLGLCLPHPDTLRRWYCCVSEKPGFTAEAIEAVKKSAECSDHPICIALMMDEMSIRKDIEWDGKEFVGYADLGFDAVNSHGCEAKEVCVIIAVGINTSWKIPIAYFLIDSLNANEKANLLKQCLCLLHHDNIIVISVTFDGHATNLALARELGATLDCEKLNTSFPHPCTERRVYIILDAVHMIKLMRNLFAKATMIYDYKDRMISWRYIVDLQKLQEAEGLHLANKVKKNHIQWYQQKMKVALAVQVLSASVGNALLFLGHDLKMSSFLGVEATAEFCLKMDRLFDLCNSRNPVVRGFKAVLRKSTKPYWQSFLNEMENYLLGLKNAEGVPIYKTTLRTPIVGFLCLSKSLQGIFDDLVETDILKYLATYKMSQDHIELFFGRIRSRGGWNNNPSACQFQAAYRRLLVSNEVVAKHTGNCIPQDATSILACEKIGVHDSLSLSLCRLYEVEQSSSEMFSTGESVDVGNELVVSTLNILSNYCENVIVYIAGFVVRNVLKRLVCPDCAFSLVNNADIHEVNFEFLNRKDNGGLIKPSSDAINVCQEAEIHLRFLLNKHNGKPPKGKNLPLQLQRDVLNDLPVDHLFLTLHEHAMESEFPENHIIVLIKLLIAEFLKVRMYHIGKMYTEKLHTTSIRQKLNKAILFSHQ